MTTLKQTHGFTMTELMLSISIFAMTITALAAIQQMAATGQANSMVKTVLDNNATMMGKTLRRALLSTSHIQYPTVGVIDATYLTAWDNTDPTPPNASIMGPTRTFKHLCVQQVTISPPAPQEQARDDLYLYTGNIFPMPAITCGNAPPMGVTRILVAGGLPGMTITPRFSRHTNNVVTISYEMKFFRRNTGMPDCSRKFMCVEHKTQMNLRGAEL